MDNAFDIQKLIDYLEGTCNSLEEGCATFDIDEDDLTDEQHQQIDDQIFHCSDCGWWYEISVMAEREDEQICEGCNEE